MSDVVTVGKEVIKWLLTKKAKRTAQVEKYLEHIQAICTQLIDMDEPLSDKAILLQKQVQQIYELAADRLPKTLMDREGWNLYKGLSSARIYYWIRVMDSKQNRAHLDQLMEDRKRLSPSLDSLLKMLATYKDDPNALYKIKEQCLKDIALILEIRPFF
jgi:hypothetical protein